MWQLLPLILNGTPLTFCHPSDTTLASCGLARYEYTLAIWEIYFCLKSQIPLLYRMNATASGLNIKWYSAYVLPSQRHTIALRGLASFENTLAIWDIHFCPKSQIRLLNRIIATTSKFNMKWHSAYVMPSQRHHRRLMWICQLREHSRHLRHIFLPENTNSTFVLDKCDNFCPYY